MTTESVQWDCDGWVAIHDHMPGKRPLKIRVEGTCMMPQPGWKLKLERGNPGINPEPGVLFLDLEGTPPTDPQSTVLTPAKVSFEEATDEEHRLVLIHHGRVARIEVEHPQ
jgi:hypothetical protein